MLCSGVRYSSNIWLAAAPLVVSAGSNAAVDGMAANAAVDSMAANAAVDSMAENAAVSDRPPSTTPPPFRRPIPLTTSRVRPNVIGLPIACHSEGKDFDEGPESPDSLTLGDGNVWASATESPRLDSSCSRNQPESRSAWGRCDATHT
jgi:hypothetical protein